MDYLKRVKNHGCDPFQNCKGKRILQLNAVVCTEVGQRGAVTPTDGPIGENSILSALLDEQETKPPTWLMEHNKLPSWGSKFTKLHSWVQKHTKVRACGPEYTS